MTVEPDGDAIYAIGGWGVDTKSTVLKIEIPTDLCNLWPKRMECLKLPGCGYCANQLFDNIVEDKCHSNAKECPLAMLRITNCKTISIFYCPLC